MSTPSPIPGPSPQPGRLWCTAGRAASPRGHARSLAPSASLDARVQPVWKAARSATDLGSRRRMASATEGHPWVLLEHWVGVCRGTRGPGWCEYRCWK